jgi:Rhodopirellula transposase DDE domain
VNLLVIPSKTGGIIMEKPLIPTPDGGGSNNANHYIFKQDLQKLVDEIGIEIRIAHYLPIHLSIIPLNIDFFLILPELVKE